MTRLIVLWLAIASSAQNRVAAPPPGPYVTVTDSAGKLLGAFQPRMKPCQPTDSVPVSVFLYWNKNVKDPDGQAVTGFAFCGWQEARVIKVQVSSLVPKPGRENRYWGNSSAPDENLRRQELATLALQMDKKIPIEKMKSLGIEPMVLRLQSKPPE